MRILWFLAKLLFILCLPALLLAASIAGAVNSLWLYQYGFEKYDVSRTTGLPGTELAKAAEGLIDYFNSDEEYINLIVIKDGQPLELFKQREIAHLRDVKGLFRLDYCVLLGALVYALGYTILSLVWRRQPGRLAWGLIGGGSLTLGLMLILGLAILLNFDQLFRQFHLISFSNELWQLDPTHDYLIMLFPGGFWYDAARFCALATVVGAVALGGVGGYLLLRRTRLINK